MTGEVVIMTAEFCRLQIQRGNSADLSTVVNSVNANTICIKGVIAVPEVGHDGDLQNLAQSFKNNLDLYANVVKVNIWRFRSYNHVHPSQMSSHYETTI